MSIPPRYWAGQVTLPQNYSKETGRGVELQDNQTEPNEKKRRETSEDSWQQMI